eukprot:365083-Chlamydomonas_euryale.AAC.46
MGKAHCALHPPRVRSGWCHRRQTQHAPLAAAERRRAAQQMHAAPRGSAHSSGGWAPRRT